jgi:hypothetical protein
MVEFFGRGGFIMKNLKKIPKFKNESEEFEFWRKKGTLPVIRKLRS